MDTNRLQNRLELLKRLVDKIKTTKAEDVGDPGKILQQVLKARHTVKSFRDRLSRMTKYTSSSSGL